MRVKRLFLCCILLWEGWKMDAGLKKNNNKYKQSARRLKATATFSIRRAAKKVEGLLQHSVRPHTSALIMSDRSGGPRSLPSCALY